MNFKCEMCSYSARDKSDYKKHLITKKHKGKVNEQMNESNENPKRIIKENLKNPFICQHCNNNFSTAANLSRHDKACFKKIQITTNYKNEISILKNELESHIKALEQKDETINQKDETISILKSEVAHLKSIVNNTGSIVKTSVSTMAYVIKNYKDAPVLESVNDYSAIHYEQNNTEFVENLIYEHNNNKLHIYISDFIIKTYKKGDPAKQSLWNSDTSRLTYLIREIITNNKVDWKVDKKGIKTTKFIIEPILKYIDDQIRNYVESYEIDHKVSAKEAERQMMKLKSGMEIIKNIETKVLSEEILKYITPYFYLIKNDDTIDD